MASSYTFGQQLTLLKTTTVTGMFHRVVAGARTCRPAVSVTRAYTTVRTPVRKIAPKAAASSKATAAPSSTNTPGRGNPKIVETLPTTADEVDIPPEVYSAQPESVPSSSALQHSSSTSAVPVTPVSFVPVEFSESTSLGGTPADPSTPDWSRSYFGLSMQPFPKEVADILLASVESKDVEIKPGVCERFRKVMSVAD